jgi:hypothetical protein
MDIPRICAPRDRTVGFILGLGLADAAARFGRCSRFGCSDLCCLTLDVATLGACGGCCPVSALLTAKRQSVVSRRVRRGRLAEPRSPTAVNRLRYREIGPTFGQGSKRVMGILRQPTSWLPSCCQTRSYLVTSTVAPQNPVPAPLRSGLPFIDWRTLRL